MDFYFNAATLGTLLTVIVIDVVLAGDNALVVGMAAAGLPPAQRRRVIIVGIAVATVLRIGLSFIARELLAIVGLTLAGGFLLLWVAWKFFRDLARGGHAAGMDAPTAARNFRAAVFRIVVADLSMSIDNVLAIAGAAREHPVVMAVGLLLSVALMGAASAVVARLMGRFRWISWVGLLIITFVALHLIYDGSIEVADNLLGFQVPWLR